MGIFVGLSMGILYFVSSWIAALRRGSKQSGIAHYSRVFLPSLTELGAGFVTNFFDTLGIGSFATTTTIFKIGRMVRDELIPGTMNVGHTLPTILQAFLYIAIIQVELRTLLLLIGSAVLGAWWGAGLVARLPRRTIQLGVGAALTVSVLFMAMAQLHWFPIGGEKLALGGLPGVLLAAFIVKSLPLETLRWLVMVVAFWGALLLFRSALHGTDPRITSAGINGA